MHTAHDAARAAIPTAPATPPDPHLPPDITDPDLAAWHAERAGDVDRRWQTRCPATMATAHVDQLDGYFADAWRRWTAAGYACNVLMLGPVGVGKTWAALAMGRERHMAGARVEFWPVVELLDAIRPGGGDPDVLDRAIAADVLILDDLGAERPTDWTGERLYLAINRRALEGRPIIATSNLRVANGKGPLVDAVGPRIYSRLVAGAVAVKARGDDRRRTGS